eukprot:g3070.t1
MVFFIGLQLCLGSAGLVAYMRYEQGHAAEGTWVTLDEVLSKEGKDSSGESARPIDAAAMALKFDIVVYLAGKGVKGEKFAGTPIVRACEKGDLDGVKAFVEGHDVEKTGISVDEMVSKEGKDSFGDSYTPLQSAVWKEQLEIVQFLVKTCTNKVDIIGQTNSNGVISLHYAASDSKKNVQMLQFLIDNYNGNIKTIINQKHKNGSTPLDCAYASTMNPPIKKEIVSLLRKYGGKANEYDKNGNKVGEGKGDLND